MKRILVVDDDPAIADVIEQFFDSPEYDVCTLLAGEKVPETVSRIKPDLILLDLKLPDMDGIDVLKELKRVGSQAPVVIITGNVSAEVAMEAMKEGAYEYLPKPFRLEELSQLVGKLLPKDVDLSSLEDEHRPVGSEELVGRSPQMLKIGKMIGQAASSEAPILITGESGTGKELVARIIHRNSRRKDKPFLMVNCAYPSPEMLEGELFGRTEKTDESSGYVGKLELGNGGTIFLDDVSNMSLSIQNRLLSALKKGEIVTPGNKTIKVDVRIIAVSAGDLSKSVSAGEFMQELFYYLRVISIPLSPLRERKSDIPLFADYFLNKYREQSKERIEQVSADAMKLLMSYFWPGNVGELENNIYSAVVMCKGDQILPEHLPIFHEGKLQAQMDFQEGGDDYFQLFMQTLDPIGNRLFEDLKGKVYGRLITSLEKVLISMALKHCNSNQVKAAGLLGISRNTLRERMLKFGLCEREKAISPASYVS